MRRWYFDSSLYGTFPVPKPAGWPIGRLCGHPQPIKIWFPTVFWGIFGYFHQNFTKTQILEFSVNYMIQKCFGSLKTSQRTLEIILSQYNGEKKFLLNFENYPWTLNFLENPWFWKQFCVFLLKNLVTFEGQLFYFFFSIVFFGRPQQRPYERQKFLPTDSNKNYLL